jgi:hypothetical protein
MLVADVDLISSLGLGVMYDFDLILPLMGVLSWEELDGVRPFLAGVEVLRGVEDPKPTGVCL